MKALAMIDFKKGLTSDLVMRLFYFIFMLTPGFFLGLGFFVYWIMIFFINKIYPSKDSGIQNCLPIDDTTRHRFEIRSKLIYSALLLVSFVVFGIFRQQSLSEISKGINFILTVCVLDLLLESDLGNNDTTPIRVWGTSLLFLALVLGINHVSGKIFWPMERYVVKFGSILPILIVGMVFNAKHYRKYGYGTLVRKRRNG